MYNTNRIQASDNRYVRYGARRQQMAGECCYGWWWLHANLDWYTFSPFLFPYPITFPFGTYPICTFPANGTKWCSHNEKISISRTITISLQSSSKIAPFTIAIQTYQETEKSQTSKFVHHHTIERIRPLVASLIDLSVWCFVVRPTF